MTAMARALWAETLKMKRTLALWLAIVMPAGVAGLQFLIAQQRGAYLLRLDENPWLGFGQQMFLMWALLMLPLFIALETALLGELEHGSSQWKHLYALPLPRWAVYAAKQLAGMVLIALSTVLLVAFTVLAGLLMDVLRPDLGFAAGIPWERLIKFAVGTYLASWLLISIHTWIGLRWQSFVVAMGVGIVATIGALILAEMEAGSFYPWTLPGIVSDAFLSGEVQWMELLTGCLGGIVVVLAGCRDFIRRDVL